MLVVVTKNIKIIDWGKMDDPLLGKIDNLMENGKKTIFGKGGLLFKLQNQLELHDWHFSFIGSISRLGELSVH